MSRSEKLILLVILAALASTARAQDDGPIAKEPRPGPVVKNPLPGNMPAPKLPAKPASPTSPAEPTAPGPMVPGPARPTEVAPDAPTTPRPVTRPGDPLPAPVPNASTAPVSSTTHGGSSNGFIAAIPGYAGGYPLGAMPYGGDYGGTGGPMGLGQSGGGGGGQATPMVELKFPDEPKNTNPNASSSSSSGSSPSSTKSGSSSGVTSPSAKTGGNDDAPGLPAPSASKGAPIAAPPPPKKPYTEGHVVLFLRAPGDEDPSPAGVKARYSLEAKIVKRLAADVAQGTKPATKPEDAVLRDPAPQGFYLPDEVDAWLVTPEGTIVLLESENVTFDKIASLGLAARLNVIGTESDVALDPAIGTVTKIKVTALTLDGSEPKLEAPAGIGYGGERG